MEELLAYRIELLSALEQVINELSEKVTHLPPTSWHQPVGPESLSPHYIVFHLRALETQVFALQLPRFMAENTLTTPSFDDEDWMAIHYNPDEPVAEIMAEMTKLRQHELSWLRELSSADWSRSARHPWWGEHTLQWWVELQLDYSYQHLNQLPAL